MCGYVQFEKERLDSFRDLFDEFSGFKLVPATLDRGITDGSFLLDSKHMLCNLEVKSERGLGGGDPYMQNFAYYVI